MLYDFSWSNMCLPKIGLTQKLPLPSCNKTKHFLLGLAGVTYRRMNTDLLIGSLDDFRTAKLSCPHPSNC